MDNGEERMKERTVGIMSVEQRSKHTHTLWLDGQWNDGLSESRVQLNDHSQRVF